MTATPPPIPPAPPPPTGTRAGLSPLAITLIVVGSLVMGVVVMGVVVAFGAATTVVPQMQRRQTRLTCQQNLSMLGTTFVMTEYGQGSAPKLNGPALLLSWRRNKSYILRGREDVLRCPGDDLFRALESDDDRAAFDTIDLANPPRDACSYAVRDFSRFPLPAAQDQPEIFAACTHHDDGANIVYVDGQVRFCSWAELGITGRADADVGPNAKSPILRQVCRTPGVTEK